MIERLLADFVGGVLGVILSICFIVVWSKSIDAICRILKVNHETWGDTRFLKVALFMLLVLFMIIAHILGTYDG